MKTMNPSPAFSSEGNATISQQMKVKRVLNAFEFEADTSSTLLLFKLLKIQKLKRCVCISSKLGDN